MFSFWHMLELCAVVAILLAILITRRNIMSGLERLKADIAAQTTVINSAKTLITSIPQMLRDAAGDEDAVNALADEIEASTADLTTAIAAGTVAEDEPAAPPVPAPGDEAQG